LSGVGGGLDVSASETVDAAPDRGGYGVTGSAERDEHGVLVVAQRPKLSVGCVVIVERKRLRVAQPVEHSVAETGDAERDAHSAARGRRTSRPSGFLPPNAPATSSGRKRTKASRWWNGLSWSAAIARV